MFGDRKLKNRIHELEDDNDVLRENTKVVRVEIEDLKERLTAKTIQRDCANSLLVDRTKELEELKTKVRAQNEADLMFVSVKIVAELLKGKKLKDVKSDQEKMQHMASMYSQAQQASGYANSLSSLLGSLGL